MTAAERKARVAELCQHYATDDRELPNLIVDLEEANDRLRASIRGAADYIEARPGSIGDSAMAERLRREAGLGRL